MRSLTPAKVSMIMFLVVGGLIVAYVAKGLFAKTETKPQATTRNVPMAIADLPIGTLIREEHLGMGPVQVSMLRPDMLLQNRVVVGRVTKEVVKAARPILAGQLYEPGAHPPLVTAKGKRTYSFPLRESTSLVDGLIKPGEYVDILFTPSDSGTDPRTRGLTVRLMKGVKLIAINRMTLQAPVDNDRNTVTVEATPQQVNALALAKDRGTLSLVHTPDGEGDGKLALAELKDQDRATLEEILGLTPPKQPEPPPMPKPPFLTQIYRSTGRQDMRFSPNGEILENVGGWWLSPYTLQQQTYTNFYNQNPQLQPQLQQQMQMQQQMQLNRPANETGNGAQKPSNVPTSSPGLGQPGRQPRPAAPVGSWGNSA